MKRIILAGTLVISILFFIFYVKNPIFFEQHLLLEKKYPGYGRSLMNAHTEIIDDNGGSRQVTQISKDELFNITPYDIKLLLNQSKYVQHVNYVTLDFNDGSGIEIPISNLNEVTYGIINGQGQVIEDKISISLGNKITDQLPDKRNDYIQEDIDGNIVSYQFRDQFNNPISGPYEYSTIKRKYDSNGNIISEAYYDKNNQEYIQMGGYSSFIQKWENTKLISRRYLKGEIESNRVDGYSKVVWLQNEKKIWNMHFFDINGDEISPMGINLVTDIKYGADGWSEWMIPKRDSSNVCFSIGYTSLDEKTIGDEYTCQLEIEFNNVSASDNGDFCFKSQGAQDGKWTAGNIWNNQLVYIKAVPVDGVYSFVQTVKLTSDMVDINKFNIGFRADYWQSGSFRVRNIKIEKGNIATLWSPGV